MQWLLRAVQAKKLDRTAAVYAVAGWILVQGAAIALPAFEAPVWALRVFIAGVLAGFPVALAIAWTTTPHPHPHKVAAKLQATYTDRALLALLGAVVVLSLAQFAYQFWVAPTRSSASLTPAESRNAGSQSGVPAVSGPAPTEASIAVLPFENLSSDPNAGYFAAGIQDEILTRLTKIGALKVISRTSTAHFASRPDNLPKIARELGVANILEGSVQKIGNAVHINVQLINAASDAHLWAEIYDRKLDDVFAVEGEVATAIAENLNAKVTSSEQRAIAVKPTNNQEAYDAYLRGQALIHKYDSQSVRSAQQFFEQAVRLDPNFASAWAMLARAHALAIVSGYDTTGEGRMAAHAALDTALRLAPDLADVRLAQGYYQYWVEQDYGGAHSRLEQLLAAWPNNAEILEALALVDRRQGKWDQSKAYFVRAIALDPLSPSPRGNYASLLLVTRDYRGALHVIDEALNIWPDNSDFIAADAFIYQRLGQLDQADSALMGLHLQPGDSFAIFVIVKEAELRRRYAEAIGRLEGLLELDRASATTGLDSSDLNLLLGDLRLMSGDEGGAKTNYVQARDKLLIALKAEPNNSDINLDLALVYCGLADRETSMQYADRAVNLLTLSGNILDGADGESERARIEARFGERDRAIPALARLLKSPSKLTPAILRLDPDFDKLRGDPRFDALLRF